MNFFIIHGVYANPEANWFPWLKKELENKGFEVIVPKFPTPLDQSLESWMRTIAKYEGRINKETVLIGHSLGATFILNYLENTGKKINAACLIAPFHKLLGSPYDKLNKTFIDKQFDWEKIKSSCSKFFIFASDNDKYIPFDITKELIKKLNAKFSLVPNGGHLNKESGYDKLPILLETIKTELGF
ncbi:serine hydrolase family protein [Candidatus Woesearchaeota archaeon]|nr:serine hydrolase family protein [Candidatus Woesearchaeota archaeon]